jgi:hypothetical protein
MSVKLFQVRVVSHSRVVLFTTILSRLRGLLGGLCLKGRQIIIIVLLRLFSLFSCRLRV